MEVQQTLHHQTLRVDQHLVEVEVVTSTTQAALVPAETVAASSPHSKNYAFLELYQRGRIIWNHNGPEYCSGQGSALWLPGDTGSASGYAIQRNTSDSYSYAYTINTKPLRDDNVHSIRSWWRAGRNGAFCS